MSRYFQWTLLGCHEYLYVSDWTETLVEAPFGISAFFLKRRSTEHRLSSVRTETHFSKLHLNDLSELSCDLNCKLLGSLNFLSSLILHTLSEELLSHKFLFNLLSTNLFIKIIIPSRSYHQEKLLPDCHRQSLIPPPILEFLERAAFHGFYYK